nr:hypothetical protein [uncultured Holophaga sp.]
MSDCELLRDCPFFDDRMATTPALAEVYKATYCREDNRACARFRVYRQRSRASVPPDLYPHMLSEAELILSGPDCCRSSAESL